MEIMFALPVFLLLVLDLLLFFGAALLWDKSPAKKENFLLSALFLGSGMPALIYQVVWQRTLFAIYGVNAESVASVVSAFMLGLGLGSLLGGWLSARFPNQALMFFGISELGVALFGLNSLRIFHWAATISAGARLASVILFSTAVLLVPTLLMGATLPLLVEHFVARSGRVGISVSRLYFANTLGSAISCFLCAAYILRNFGQSGSVTLGACLNAFIGGAAYLYGRSRQSTPAAAEAKKPANSSVIPMIGLPKALLFAALSGFIGLGLEIIWFRVFALASADRAPAFALLLATYLAGIAAGAYLCEKFTADFAPARVLAIMGLLLLVAGAVSPFLPGVVATLVGHNFNYLWSAPGFFIIAGMVGCILPLLCQLSVAADEKAGRKVGLIYACNIAGSVAGSLGIGFVWMQYFGLRAITLQLAAISIFVGAAFLLILAGFEKRPSWVWAAVFVSALAVPLAFPSFDFLFERLTFGTRPESHIPFAHIVENRNGVVCATREGAVFGGGVYDGHFLIEPSADANFTVRAFVVTGTHPSPKRVLMIGLASGSWAQILINDPRVEQFDAVEINPGYLKLIPDYPVVRSLLNNPKINLYVDDGRRWLLAHPEKKYDMIVANATYHWRDHSTTLLSREFFQMIRRHLNPGGIYYFNTTESDEAMATSLDVFPYGLRIINFVAVSDRPIVFDKQAWLNRLSTYRIDGRNPFDPLNPKTPAVLAAYSALIDTVNGPPRFMGLESSDSMRARLGAQKLITDDNMGREWTPEVALPWRQ
jgi:spermidine synthase